MKRIVPFLVAGLLFGLLPPSEAQPPTFAGVVQNMPGATSIIAANHVYNVARPDGLTLGLFDRSVLTLGQLLKVDGIRFDTEKFNWIGSTASETTILAIRADLPYRTVEDLRKADPPVVIGATAPASNTYVSGEECLKIVREVLNAPPDVVRILSQFFRL